MSESHIYSLFNPKTVAVIGASHNEEKIGYKVIDNMVSGGYKGKIYPVNPRGGEILGVFVYKKILDIPEESIDIAIIVVPAHLVVEVARDCAEKHVKNLVVITSGFSEIGNYDDEKELVEIAKANNMRILGPNIFGVYTKSVSLNATFGPKYIKPGYVAMLTQSGAIGIGMIGKTEVANLGLSTIVSIGNKLDIDETELLAYLAEDDDTRIIMMYMEGVKEGDKFVKVLKKITPKKPVIVIKSGRSKRGAMATASHTGSLAGEDAVFDDIMKQCGVLRAESIQVALDWCKYFVNMPQPQGAHGVIITNGGGLGVLATDACEKYGVELYDDQKNMEKIYAGAVSSFGSTKNPIDLTGGATAEDYAKSIDASIKNDEIHSIIGLYCETAVFAGDELPEVIEQKYKDSIAVGKPIVFSLFGGAKVEEYTKKLSQKNVPVYGDVYEALSPLGALYRYNKLISQMDTGYTEVNIDFDKINKLTQKVLDDGRSFLLANEAQEVMSLAQLSCPKSFISTSAQEAVKLASELHFPVVMKIVSKDIIHKSDAGGVKVGINSEDEVRDAFEAIMTNCKNYKPDADIKGIEVYEMVPDGTQVIVGAKKDPSFGPIVMFGMGGIYVEVLKDVAFRSYPLSKIEAERMIKDIKMASLLEGVRGEAPREIDGIVDVILKIGAIIKNCPDISDIEINPVMVYEKGKNVKGVDVRILLSK